MLGVPGFGHDVEIHFDRHVASGEAQVSQEVGHCLHIVDPAVDPVDR